MPRLPQKHMIEPTLVERQLIEALKRIRDEASVFGDWRETASLIDSICVSAILNAGYDL